MSRNRRTLGGVIPSIDSIVETRYDAALELVRQLQAKRPGATPDQIVDELVRKYSKELAAVAAFSGGAAATPGVGTATGIFATSADLAYTITRLGEMVLAIGVAHGHTSSSFEDRKAWLQAVLSVGRSAVAGVEGLAGRVGSGGGSRMARAINATQLDAVNSKLFVKVLTRLSSEQAAARLGTLLPFGIGAGVGAAGNVVIVRSVARSARQYFSAEHPVGGQRPYPGSIEVSATEVVRPTPSEPQSPPG